MAAPLLCAHAVTRPRLIVHIGTHKTGTTAIQQALGAQRRACLSNGVFYPPTDREPWPDLPKHCSVFAAAARGDAAQADAERHWLRTEFERSGAHAMLVSEEGLSEPQPRLAQFFAPLATEFDITVVCLLRRPDLFVESLYNQFVREAARREARSMLMFSRAQGVRDRLRYTSILAAWQQLPARVVALDFDAAVKTQPLLQAFSSAAGIPPLAQLDQRANSSPDMRLIQLLARMNRQRLQPELGRLMHAAAVLQAEGRFTKRRHLLGRHERTQLLQDVSPEMDRLARDHGVRFSDALPADENMAPEEDIDMNYALEMLALVSSPAR
jgi:hypothetical protein